LILFDNMELKDWLNSINQTKNNLIDDDPSLEKEYTPYIINKCLSGNIDTIMFVNEMNQNSFKPFGNGETLDMLIHYQAFHYLKTKRPKAFFISYGDTDEFAHHGDYKYYLDAAHQFDEWVGNIWSWIQSDPDYKNKTTLLITTDHGRGDAIKSQWTSHGKSVADASQMWFTLIGPKVKPLGEIKKNQQLFQKQLAATLAYLAGYSFTAEHEVSSKVDVEVMK